MFIIVTPISHYDPMYLYGLAMGFLITGAVCLIGLVAMKLTNDKKQKEVEENTMIKPKLSLFKTVAGSWFIEAITNEGIFEEPIDSEMAEQIVVDYVSRDIGRFNNKYEFDITRANGEEFTVTMVRKNETH